MDEATALQMAGRAARGDLNALGAVLRALVLGQGYRTVAGTPTSVLTPRNIGEHVFDTTNNAFYRAVGTTTTSWVAVARSSETLVVPITGQAKVGATAGWVITGGTLTADTSLSAANLGATGLTTVVAAGVSYYILLTGTTAASTDIDLTHLVIGIRYS
jgi:hypothetical protein